MVSPLAETSAMQSMSSSKYKIWRRWSTPTVADYKIHKLYKESDQRRWVYKCPHCGKYQWLDYNENVKQVGPDSGIDRVSKIVLPGTFAFVCKYCGKPLDRWYSGRWVVTNPKPGAKHGYSISQMDAVWVTASSLKQQELNAESKQTFYNYVLGLPYEDTSTRFYQSDVLNNMIDFAPRQTRQGYKFVTCGVDWGQHYHHIIVLGLTPSGRIDLMNMHRVPKAVGVEHIDEDINAVAKFINKYEPDLILPDLGYNGNYVDILKKVFGSGRVYGVKVRSAESNGDPNVHFNDSDGIATLDKLTQNVIMMANMRRGDIHFYNKLDENLKLFILHWSNVVVRTDEEEDSISHQIIYKKHIMRKGDD